MTVNLKDQDAASPHSMIGMLNTIVQNPVSVSPIVSAPVTFAGNNSPQGRVQVSAQDTDLASKFVDKTKFEVTEKPKAEEGMDMATFWLLMGKDANDLGNKSDEENAADFKNFIEAVSHIPGFENIKNEQVTFGGRTVTLGQLGEGFAANGLGIGMLSQARFAPGSPMSAAAIGRASATASPEVRNAIEMACRLTGADRGAMFAIAKQESGFNPNARPPLRSDGTRASTATGLYQFLDKTWSTEVRLHGDLLRRAGIDPATASRTDPRANAIMGAAFFMDNKQSVSRTLGREANGAEVYMAHFLGAGGASKFFRELERNPSALASSVFPGAAGSNSFMNGKTLAGVENFFMSRMPA